MKTHDSHAAPEPRPDPIEAQAADWLARSDRGFSPEEAEQFARWRAADVRHAHAVDDLSSVWAALDDLATEPTITTPAAATAAAKPAAIVPWTRLALGIAAAAAVLVGASVWLRHESGPMPVARYATAVGEDRTVVLADGSEVQLNTDSVIAVRFTAGERRVLLERGEAFFAVAKNPARPFIVAAGDVESRAVGTAFVVRRQPDEIQLLVTEGKVRFGCAQADAVADVAADQWAVVAPNSRQVPRVEDITPDMLARRVAWRTGQLVFRETRLGDAVAEFNRYHREQIVLADRETADLRLGGEFRAANLDGFIHAMEVSFDLKSERREPGTIVLAPKAR